MNKVEIDSDMKEFYHPMLDKYKKNDLFECHFNQSDEKYHLVIEKEIKEVIVYLKSFFKIETVPEITIFLYHNIEMMNKAFKRTLPSDQCCFVPIKDKKSLITFTSKIEKTSLKQVLAHEISHIIFAKLSGNREVNDIQQTIPVWLDEGLALYVDRKYRANIKQIELKRRELFKKSEIDYFPHLMTLYTYFNKIDQDIEFGPKGTMAYAYSYFCVTNLIGKYGKNAIVKFIKSLPGKEKEFDTIFNEFFGYNIKEFNEKMRGVMFSDENNM